MSPLDDHERPGILSVGLTDAAMASAALLGALLPPVLISLAAPSLRHLILRRRPPWKRERSHVLLLSSRGIKAEPHRSVR
jgi:hypothetical protein